MNENAIILRDANTRELAEIAALEAIATPEILERRDDLIDAASRIPAEITTDEEAAEASEIAGKLKGFKKDVEAARTAIKQPVLLVGQSIDVAARSAAQPALDAIERLEKLLAGFAARREAARREEIRQKEEQARRNAEEERRKAQEKADAAREKAEEAERIAQEARLASSQAVSTKGDGSLLDSLDAEMETAEKSEEAQRLQEEADSAARTAAAAAEMAAAPTLSVLPPAPAQTRISGASVRRELDFAIEDIAALYAAKPDWVELRPRTGLIKASLKAASQQANGWVVTIPGLRLFYKTSVATRAS